jgi:peptidoglycan hydrolase CwlO-like protein
MGRIIKVLMPVVLVSMVLAGCGGGVSEDKPLSEVRIEAKEMTIDQLKGTIEKYKKAIEAKKADLVKCQEKIRQIPPTEMLGEQAKKVKNDISNVTKSIRALTDRLNVYARELRVKM